MNKLIDDNELAKYLIANYSLSIGECNHLAMFIQQQKRAHGDMVIGEDESLYSELENWDEARNDLRAEQRERNAS